MYLGRKNDTENNLLVSVVLQLDTSLKDTHCTVYFEKFISCPNLVKTLLEQNIYNIGRSNRKNIPKFSPAKSMKRDDGEFQYSKGI